MNDEQRSADERRSTDERIAAAARDLYHAPPETPREEMWATIEARLDSAEGDSDGAVVDANAPDAAVLPLRSDRAPGSSRRPTRRMAWWIGIAAALLVGLGIGRLTLRPQLADLRVASESEVETSGETTVAETSPSDTVGSGAESADRTPPTTAPADGRGRPDADDRLVSGDAAAPTPPAADRPPDDTGVGSGRAPGLQGLQYAATTRRLLDRGESFLATVQADLASGAPDPETEAWARSLLSRTRVLMASPPARDSESRRLLEDLELMLAQIVVTTATGDPGEARILGEGLEDGDLLYRLRSAMEENDGPGGFRAPRTSSL
ncbi:MAG: hypothetical protein ACODAA_03510 [Gemmatimonadota bacterium]